MLIAVVCHGNICRSPMAETVVRAELERAGLHGAVRVESFGTHGYHAGEGADPRAEAALARRGWPPRVHRARRITPEVLEHAELVLCADRDNLAQVRRLGRAAGLPAEDVEARTRLLREFDPLVAAGDEDVPDPWYGGAADFDHALELIERSSAGLVEHLSRELGAGGAPSAAAR